MNKWRSITMVAAPGCALLAGYMMLSAEHHHEEKIVRLAAIPVLGFAHADPPLPR
jgi:hypothetical protein